MYLLQGAGIRREGCGGNVRHDISHAPAGELRLGRAGRLSRRDLVLSQPRLWNAQQGEAALCFGLP